MRRQLLLILLVALFGASCGAAAEEEPGIIESLSAPRELPSTTSTSTTTLPPTTTTEKLNPCHVWSDYVDQLFSGAPVEEQITTNRLWLESIIPSRVRDDAVAEFDDAIAVFEAAQWDLTVDHLEYVDLLMAMLGGSLDNLNEWFMADHYLGCTDLTLTQSELGAGVAACAAAIEPMLDASQDESLWYQMIVDEAGGFIELIRPMADRGVAPGCYIGWAYYRELDDEGLAAYHSALPGGVRDYYSEFWG